MMGLRELQEWLHNNPLPSGFDQNLTEYQTEHHSSIHPPVADTGLAGLTLIAGGSAASTGVWKHPSVHADS
jgi:hypothetical protein